MPLRSTLFVHDVPAAEAYWIDHPSTEAAIRSAVEQLDVVVGSERTAVAARTVDLADDDVR